ncbi:hypothetical protein L249_4086 [Ophiocordyceps polyrhachis-furcata BCC 54312]|uniref:DUF2415 domain-containing protein n=1 Tax=Ophiocordyceps polyrhachis-furcata BCC 54312 TaxID=1330021 RepID=A0A367L510_9HYPO|nr:hypothetical protein L249_4086 [Ophiocordyceps polyrhachis-furcata BCC 54312]
MAAHDDASPYPTNAIVSKKARKHYRVPVRSQHWQLRSLISAQKRHLVYFPGGNGSNHVQRLDTLTHECETIKLLTFAPRCLAVRDGWLCCGSETGEFVAIRLDDDAVESASRLELNADLRRHFGLDGLHDESLMSLLATRQSNKSLIAKGVKLAKDRVNCVTIWSPPTLFSAAPDAYAEPVAVLANNDRTVIIVSLRDFERGEKTDPLEVVTYPDFVNRAIISPDGRLLIAILDDPYLYVHERTPQNPDSSSSSSSSSSTSSTDAGVALQWELRQKFLLKSQRKDDRSDSRGSFAACFSSSGAYLAVGTQHGTVSIFDTTLLALADGEPLITTFTSSPYLAVGTQHGTVSIFDTTLLALADGEPLITTFTSSRPESGPGAVRDMAFCPGPFDILAWTEDRGHIGFADMRSNFVMRQIIDINAEADFEHIDILDRNTIDPRLLSSNGEWRSGRSASSRRRNGEGLDTLNQPLTADETLVLEAIRSDRRRRERLSQRGVEEGSRRPDLSWTYRPTANDGDSSQRPREPSSSVGRTSGHLESAYREARASGNAQHPEWVRAARQVAREAGGQQRQSTRRPEQRLMERIGETFAAIRDQRERTDSTYLNVFDILQGRERSPAEQDDPSLLAPLVNQAMNRWEESAIRGTLVSDHGVFEVPPSPDNTAGLAWTADGRTLYIGAQNGIYELHVNVQSRKFCPSITMR